MQEYVGTQKYKQKSPVSLRHSQASQLHHLITHIAEYINLPNKLTLHLQHGLKSTGFI